MIDNTCLPDDCLLWRYMDFAELMYVIVTKSIYLMRPDQFGDPLEAFCPNAKPVEQEQAIKAANVVCWHQNDVESEAMWQLYSRDKKSSLATVVNKGVLKTLFDDSFSIDLIKYIDYKSEQPDIKKHFYIKENHLSMRMN